MASNIGFVSPGPNSSDAETTAGLLSRLMENATALGRNELALAKAEFNASLLDIKAGLTSLAIAGVVLLAGLLTLVAACVIALAQATEWWLAAVIVGGLLALIGVTLLYAARRKLTSPSVRMQRTQSSLQEDAAVVARRT